MQIRLAGEKPRHTPLEGSITPYREDGDQSINVRFSYAGQNFAFYGANTDAGHWVYSKVVPDLDVVNEFSIRIDRKLKSAHLLSTIGGDGFPNCESFLVDPANATCFVATHVRIGTASTQLPGGRVLPMTFTMAVMDWMPQDKFGSAFFVSIANDHTGDGSPHEIAPYGQTTRTAWNGLHKGRDASGDWIRQIEDNIPLPRQSIRAIKDWWNSP